MTMVLRSVDIWVNIHINLLKRQPWPVFISQNGLDLMNVVTEKIKLTFLLFG